MTTPRLYITLITVFTLLGLTITSYATDFGNPKDVKQVRRAAAKLGKVLNVSASNDWALCTAYSEADESDLSVVLRRGGNGWKVVQSDGGAFDRGTLKSLGVPAADIPSLLKAYQ